MTTTHATTLGLAEQYWAADLAYLAANTQIWATGRELDDTDPRVFTAVHLNDLLIDIGDELTHRAGPASSRPLAELLAHLDQNPTDTDQIHAAAVLRVITSGVYTTDAENLQPGRELPAVGVWAQLTD